MRSVSLSLALATLSSFLVAAVEPDSQPTITAISFSGNGCPGNGAALSGSFSNTTLTYNNFEVTVSGTDSTKNCQAHISVSAGSAGWQLALGSADTKGHVSLDPGSSLSYYTTVYYSQNAGSTATLENNLTNSGSNTLDYSATIHQAFPPSKLIWSPCSSSNGYIGILNVNFRASVDGTGDASMEVFTENLGFKWRQC